MTDTSTELIVTPDPAPGPGGRMQRSAGQVGSALVFLELWVAFGWFGADTWSQRQLLAVTAVVYYLVALVHNTWNWWSARARATGTPSSVTVTAVEADTPVPKGRRTSGQSGAVDTLTVIAVAVVVIALIALLWALGADLPVGR